MTPVPKAAGVDVGATNVKIVHVDGNGIVQFCDTFRTEDRWAENIRERLRSLPSSTPLGVCAPGLAAPDGRSIAWMQGRLAGIERLDWMTFLGRLKPVPVLNDAHAALLAESWIGAAAGARNALLLTLGTGVGGAILADGRLLRGHLGRAGHLGHVTVNAAGQPDLVNTPGSLEDAIGDCTVSKRTNGRFTTTRDLVAAHQNGDPDATAIWLTSVRDLAAAVASLINALDPEVVVIGGGIAAAGDALFTPLTAHLHHMEWRPHGHAVRIVPAALGDVAGAIGAARAALLTDR